MYTFREVAKLGLPHAIKEKRRIWEKRIATFPHDPDWRQFLKEPDAFLASGTGDLLLKEIVKSAHTDFESAVDAASLVFAHSAVDAVAWECCRLSAVVCPSDWHDAVKKRKVEVGDLEDSDYQGIMSQKVSDFIEGLERESLLRKVDLYHKRCWVGDVLEGFKFDRERLEKLDRLRHDVVHGDSHSVRLPRGDADIVFLHKTHLHLVVTLFKKYNLKYSDEYLQEP